MKQMKPGEMFNKFQDKKKKAIAKSGSFEGKSNKLGQGGRAAQLKAQGVPGGVIGNLARAAHAAPGQKNFHKKGKKGKTHKKEGLKFGSAEWRAKYIKGKKHEKKMCKTHKKTMCKICMKKHEKKETKD